MGISGDIKYKRVGEMMVHLAVLNEMMRRFVVVPKEIQTLVRYIIGLCTSNNSVCLSVSLKWGGLV